MHNINYIVNIEKNKEAHSMRKEKNALKIYNVWFQEIPEEQNKIERKEKEK